MLNIRGTVWIFYKDTQHYKTTIIYIQYDKISKNDEVITYPVQVMNRVMMLKSGVENLLDALQILLTLQQGTH